MWSALGEEACALLRMACWMLCLPRAALWGEGVGLSDSSLSRPRVFSNPVPHRLPYLSDRVRSLAVETGPLMGQAGGIRKLAAPCPSLTLRAADRAFWPPGGTVLRPRARSSQVCCVTGPEMGTLVAYPCRLLSFLYSPVLVGFTLAIS